MYNCHHQPLQTIINSLWSFTFTIHGMGPQLCMYINHMNSPYYKKSLKNYKLMDLYNWTCYKDFWSILWPVILFSLLFRCYTFIGRLYFCRIVGICSKEINNEKNPLVLRLSHDPVKDENVMFYTCDEISVTSHHLLLFLVNGSSSGEVNKSTQLGNGKLCKY